MNPLGGNPLGLKTWTTPSKTSPYKLDKYLNKSFSATLFSTSLRGEKTQKMIYRVLKALLVYFRAAVASCSIELIGHIIHE